MGITLVKAMSKSRLPRAFDAVAPGVAEASGGGATKAAVLNHSATDGLGRAMGWPVRFGAQRAVGAAVYIAEIAEHLGLKGSPGGDGPIAAPLPVPEDIAQQALAGEPAPVVAEGQLLR